MGISVRNISRRPCQLARLATSVAVVPHATGRPYATTHLATSDSVKLAPGHRATSSLVWSGWCGGGVTQWGVRLRFSPKGRSLYALVIGNVAPGSMGSLVPPVPTCRHGGSHLTMAPLVAPAGGVRTT